ncbi:MAG: outer membrane lipoprotein-sorting protein [Planctomycetes bacterium]|nr:outer membrane lipoprotein-sorting protein [Planctomycetota bacterium]
MHYRTLLAAIVFLLVTSVSTAVADEKLDALEKEIAAKWKTVKSMTAKMDMTMEVDQGGMKMKHTMKATVEYLRKGEKMLSRMEGEVEMVMDMGGQKNTMNTPILTVSDGEITHTLVEQMGQKMCMKTKADANSTTGEAMFKALREQYELTVADDEEVDGEKCWVVHAKPKQAAQPGQPVKMAFYFRQKDAATVQMLGYDASDKKVMTTTYSDIKFNEKLDPKRFEFEVPEGVQVMDRTNMP